MTITAEFKGGILDGCPVTGAEQAAAPSPGNLVRITRIFALNQIMLGTAFRGEAEQIDGVWWYRRGMHGHFYAAGGER